ncbi:MAG: hypothetical protein HQ517_10215 [SAR324 cluster bacterium]|nr:hypothetical protein [SAR324 cluster bacterium]
MQLVVEGRTIAEISKILHLSAKSIETYRSRIPPKPYKISSSKWKCRQ